MEKEITIQTQTGKKAFEVITLTDEEKNVINLFLIEVLEQSQDFLKETKLLEYDRQALLKENECIKFIFKKINGRSYDEV